MKMIGIRADAALRLELSHKWTIDNRSAQGGIMHMKSAEPSRSEKPSRTAKPVPLLIEILFKHQINGSQART
ncbi:hypothetical protein NBRC116494_02540 [Aurantivibrio plasticivorans]